MRVFTFPLHKPFIDLLACRLRADVAADDPLSLARALVLLPTRRACSSLREAFLRLGDGKPHLLPRMQPLADVDEDALLSDAWMGDASVALPPPMPRGLRQILLSRLVAANGTPDMEQAALLAQELARLMDAMATSGVAFDGLASLVPEELASHWQKTLDFLGAIRTGWPRVLEAEGMMDAIAHRNALLFALAEAWAKNPPAYPVIAAGSTGSQPATAALLKTIASLPNGMVILPWLDMHMPQKAWDAMGETHPQWGLKCLLDDLGVKRESVQMQDDANVPQSCHPERARLWSLAMQPAALTADWPKAKVEIFDALKGVERIECNSLREEARAIALRLRHALETPNARAAVITQDRALARMVASEMRRFGVQLDDSAGASVIATLACVFLRLLAEAALAQAAPTLLLALLKHPLCTLGFDAAECRRQARALEREHLRGVRQRVGLAGLRRQTGAAILEALEAAAGEFMRAATQKQSPFERLLKLHMEAAERIAGAALWAGDAGEALAAALQDLSQHASHLGVIETREYPGLFETLLAPVVVRPAYGAHPRLHILSPMEARLQHFDVAILAGLNEGSWPESSAASPWMSRPMQRQFVLPLPEEAIGKSAHDFAMLACAKEVVFTRARKAEGAETAPSRWLLRLDTLLAAMHGAAWNWQSPYAHWARQERDVALPPVAAPRPLPPVAARPQKLSVTEIETWQRDPYAIYAKHVLGLRALDALDLEPDLKDFGTLVHEALRRFADKFPRGLPERIEDEMKHCAAEAMQSLADRPAVLAFWLPRFHAMIPWLAEQEHARRGAIAELLAELKGEMRLGDFTLTTRIDRLEWHADGAFSLVDYKTGSMPDKKDVEACVSPQLALEAAIVQAGKPGAAPRSLSYWKLGGEKNEVREVSANVDVAMARLRDLIEAFSNPDMPYLACPDENYAPRYSDYEHLERKEEWEWI